MTNQERINKISEIETKLSPIGQKKIILETQLKFLKEDYLKDHKEQSKITINQLQEDYNFTNAQFNSLYFELRSFQKKYVVQYSGELIDLNSNIVYNQQYFEELFLKTECDIDTFENGWLTYMTNSDAIEVIKEIYSFIYKFRFLKFSIDNIKSLK